uniref:Reverse transcriptase domain-containing protein n=1 Tax=Megaselia scalaris TaxID=36166 RepID=T1H2N9_MEGSC
MSFFSTLPRLFKAVALAYADDINLICQILCLCGRIFPELERAAESVGLQVNGDKKVQASRR